MKQSIGFDLDMTLLDTDRALLETLRNVFPAAQHLLSEPFLVSISGLPLSEILEKLAKSDEVGEAREKFMTIYPTLAPAASRLFPGALESLNLVADLGFEPIIVSAKTSTNLDLLIEHFQLPVRHKFGGLHGVAKAHTLSQNNSILYVGDQESDVLAAHAAGIPAVRIIRNAHFHPPTQAEWVLKDMLEFARWFKVWSQNIRTE